MAKQNGITAPKGFLAAGIHCGVKKDKSLDLALIVSDRDAVAAGVVTKNLVVGAPVALTKKHLGSKTTRAIVVNAGNANVFTETADRDAERMVAATAKSLHIPARQILVASTGVIGQALPIELIEAGLFKLAPKIKVTGGSAAAKAIMTTDLVSKECVATFMQGKKEITVGGCAKGSGMIHPNMGTLLAFVTTDAAVSKPVLKEIVKRTCHDSFNRISVDGDTSTSDIFAIMANGAAGGAIIDKTSGPNFTKLLNAVTEVCVDLAKKIVRDGEGATKFVTVNIAGAKNDSDARKAAMAIAESLLVKTALFGQDANWGRLLAVAGYSGARFNPVDVAVSICGIKVFANGRLAKSDWEKRVTAKLKKRDIDVSLDLGAGSGKDHVWTCDLSYDYVRINADYRS